MFDAVAFGAGGAIFLPVGIWIVRRQRRRHAGTLAGWASFVDVHLRSSTVDVGTGIGLWSCLNDRARL
jgi:hypothetical protein